MQNRSLHIVSFDNPFPPVYGGAIEVFYKLRPLHDLGIRIHLHCFVDEIPTANPILENITAKVYYYKKNKNPLRVLSKFPFSVISRNNKVELLSNLEAVDAPILFEGLKTTYLVRMKLLKDKRKILRLHNIEHDYFNGISASETDTLKKIMFKVEDFKFRIYEPVINEFQKVISLSKFENRYISEKFQKAVYVPVFHGNREVAHLSGIGKYAIYHGDLRMSDNLRVAAYLIEIFKKVKDFSLVIASNNGEKFVKKCIGDSANITFVPIENFMHLQQLLMDAQINMIFSFQKSGTKLKLMNSLYNSRFCFINGNIIDDENVMELCEFANSESEIIRKINIFKNRPYTDYEKRKQVLETKMNDDLNAEILAKEIFKA